MGGDGSAVRGGNQETSYARRVSRVGLVRADPPAAARSAVRLPSVRPGPRDRSAPTPASILAFQRAAGNRAVGRRLQRKVTGDVLGGSVGIQFAEQLTPDEMREQVALLANALQSQKLDPTTREVLEQNLQELEEYASDAQIELPASTAYHLRKIIAALAGDAKRLVTQVKSLKNQRPTDLNWSIRWLDRVADAIIEAGTKVASGEKGGPNSAAEFAAAAKLLTGAIPMSKALAAHLAYLTVVTKVEEHYPHSWSSMMYTKLEVVRYALTPLMGTIWSGDPTRFEN